MDLWTVKVRCSWLVQAMVVMRSLLKLPRVLAGFVGGKLIVTHPANLRFSAISAISSRPEPVTLVVFEK